MKWAIAILILLLGVGVFIALQFLKRKKKKFSVLLIRSQARGSVVHDNKKESQS